MVLRTWGQLSWGECAGAESPAILPTASPALPFSDVNLSASQGKGCVLLAAFTKPRHLQVDLAILGENVAGSGGATLKYQK
jgi:hypothetical protein